MAIDTSCAVRGRERHAGAVSDDVVTPKVRVYWRRGCWFCSSLRRQLAEAGLVTEEHDIWADDEAAAFVRAHAGQRDGADRRRR